MVANWVQRKGSDRDVDRRTRQIKEIVRLGTELRADMGLDAVFNQVTEAISSTLGFRIAVLNIIYPRSPTVEVVATSGLSDDERARLTGSPPQVTRLLTVMRPEFCVSHSYYLSHEHRYLLDGLDSATGYPPVTPMSQRSQDTWHQDDVILVPLMSPRAQDHLLGTRHAACCRCW